MSTDQESRQPETSPAPELRKGYKGLPLEGFLARWYARNTAKDMAAFRQLAAALAARLPRGCDVLEVAPGPGYLAIELARLGPYRIAGLDISASFVQIARAKAKQAGVAGEIHHGHAAQMPFGADTIDFIICRAAFKNFTEPVQAIREMHRVLKLGGTALIIDLRGDASPENIRTAVSSMSLSTVNRLMTQATFKYFLLKNAYTGAQIRQMVAQTPFAGCDIREDTIGMEIWLEK
jgi:ubiquinone/menaquinone biosynthesis C-methylase UbiE